MTLYFFMEILKFLQSIITQISLYVIQKSGIQLKKQKLCTCLQRENKNYNTLLGNNNSDLSNKDHF